ncbi:hypothetical protein FRC12_006363 [Ceratobasidium sp. 428]|nr:hypothetical protein FRC12_006363 [Ceratobasidium sp. 428]
MQCLQVATGLAYLHKSRVIFGDLKGNNILVGHDGVAKLTDFGLSVMEQTKISFSSSQNPGGGSARWMVCYDAPVRPQFIKCSVLQAPELIRGPAGRSSEADVYALGITFIEILTDQVPFPKLLNDMNVMFAIANEGLIPDRPSQLKAQSLRHDRWWQLLQRCWDRDPSLRPKANEWEQLERDFGTLAPSQPHPENHIPRSADIPSTITQTNGQDEQDLTPHQNGQREREHQLQGLYGSKRRASSSTIQPGLSVHASIQPSNQPLVQALPIQGAVSVPAPTSSDVIVQSTGGDEDDGKGKLQVDLVPQPVWATTVLPTATPSAPLHTTLHLTSITTLAPAATPSKAALAQRARRERERADRLRLALGTPGSPNGVNGSPGAPTPSEVLNTSVPSQHSLAGYSSPPITHPALPSQTYDLESLAAPLETHEAAFSDSEGLTDGVYHICNIRHGKKVVLLQDADKEDLIGSYSTSGLEGSKWAVKRHDNTSKYSITNVDYNWNAACDYMPRKDGNVFTSRHLYQWMILPTGNEENCYL